MDPEFEVAFSNVALCNSKAIVQALKGGIEPKMMHQIMDQRIHRLMIVYEHGGKMHFLEGDIKSKSEEDNRETAREDMLFELQKLYQSASFMASTTVVGCIFSSRFTNLMFLPLKSGKIRIVLKIN